VLSDATARRLYNRYGPEGMRRHGGAEAGTGNARRAWDEFKVIVAPYTASHKSAGFFSHAPSDTSWCLFGCQRMGPCDAVQLLRHAASCHLRKSALRERLIADELPHAQPFKRENKRTRARDAARAAAPVTAAQQTTAAQPAGTPSFAPATEAAADFVFAEPVLDIGTPVTPQEDPLQARSWQACHLLLRYCNRRHARPVRY